MGIKTNKLILCVEMVYSIWKLICFLLISKKLKRFLGSPNRPWALSLLGLMDKTAPLPRPPCATPALSSAPAAFNLNLLTGSLPPRPLT